MATKLANACSQVTTTSGNNTKRDDFRSTYFTISSWIFGDKAMGDKGGSKDKGKREKQKKAKQSPKEKRRAQKVKKNALAQTPV